jgi:hypothetical protein
MRNASVSTTRHSSCEYAGSAGSILEVLSGCSGQLLKVDIVRTVICRQVSRVDPEQSTPNRATPRTEPHEQSHTRTRALGAVQRASRNVTESECHMLRFDLVCYARKSVECQELTPSNSRQTIGDRDAERMATLSLGFKRRLNEVALHCRRVMLEGQLRNILS